MMLALCDSLERRYDGPIPPADPAAVSVAAAPRAHLFQRLAREAREQAATRRRTLNGESVLSDARLRRLTGALDAYRANGVAWRP